MKNAAIIKDGIVANIITVGPTYAGECVDIPPDQTVAVGDSYLDGVFISKEEEPDRIPDYAERRRGEYPPIGDQLDALMKWISTESEFNVPAELKSIAMTCMSVKAKYPKPAKG